MRALIRVAAVVAVSFLAVGAMAADDHSSIVVVFKDGHQRAFSMAEIVRIDFKAPSMVVFKDGHQEKLTASDIARIEFETGGPTAVSPSRAHFIGKWEAGDGSGHKFYITLEPDGDARKTLGAAHGTWTVVDGEARIAWDDGWHDTIRKVGAKHEKLAWGPGRSTDEEPSNVTEARNTQARPI